MLLDKFEISDIIGRLQNGQDLPDVYKYKLFPVNQREYELIYAGKMRREDVLANEDGVHPVPLQIEKVFNGKRKKWSDGWKNMISFGDNLQFLKTIYENKDLLIKDKVKGKVKLIYIDPPFATEADFKSKTGQKAYNDKAKGSEFIEFLRRRLIVARELLSDDGAIYVHLDLKKGHYVKTILDEIFGESNFMNELIWLYSGREMTYTYYNQKHQAIYFYAKNREQLYFDWKSIGDEPKPAVIAQYKNIDEKTGERYVIRNSSGSKGLSKEGPDTYRQYYKPVPPKSYFEVPIVSSGDENIDYPTQKPEKLIERFIKASTKEGDIVMDFFSGSGTTVSVAEKLHRKWIACDIGKLSFYTIQKRMLNIQDSKSLIHPKRKYNKECLSFITMNTGHYDLEKVFTLQQQEYSNFVMNLFEVEPKEKKISGIQIDGEKKDGYNVIIWPYWKFEDATVDEDYILDLHSHIGKKSGRRVYIIAPASYVDFISDYYEVEKVRYYFLKVPYHIIKELHKVQFKKFRQPQSKNNVNDLEDAVGFHFIRQPEVKSDMKIVGNNIQISIKKFLSYFTEENTEREMDNFESLSMVMIDKDFDDETFDLDLYYFAEDLLVKNKKKEAKEITAIEVESISNELKQTKQIILPPIPKKNCGKKIMLVYVDIYGNEFKESFIIK